VQDDDDEVHVIGGNEAKNKCGERKHGGSKSCTEESEEVSDYEDTAKEKAESRKLRRKSMSDKKGVGKKNIYILRVKHCFQNSSLHTVPRTRDVWQYHGA